MDQMMSCCGVVCSQCGYYPEECKGCSEIEGKVFWLQYTGGDICDIYDCCIHRKKLEHCGRCKELPCSFYDRNDPTISEEENERCHKAQIELLRSLK